MCCIRTVRFVLYVNQFVDHVLCGQREIGCIIGILQ